MAIGLMIHLHWIEEPTLITYCTNVGLLVRWKELSN